MSLISSKAQRICRGWGGEGSCVHLSTEVSAIVSLRETAHDGSVGRYGAVLASWLLLGGIMQTLANGPSQPSVLPQGAEG